MIDTMPRKLPLNVTMERNRHGTVVFYHRIGKGKRTRVYGVPGSAEFTASYLEAIGNKPASAAIREKDAKSLRWLVDRYKESIHWSGLSDATRKQQGLFFKKMVESAGRFDYREIDDGVIEAAMEERANTPALANNFLKALRGLFKWALKNKHIDADPTVSTQRLKNKSEGFPPWEIEDAIKFCEKWDIGTTARLAFELLLVTGLRRSDIVKIGRQHMRGNVLTIKTQKTGAVITAEFSDALMGLIGQTKTGDLHFIVNANGTPYTVESFGNWFRDCCRAAGVEKSAHGVRKLSATIAANDGSTTLELMSMYGWRTSQQAEVYTKGADRVKLGVKTSRKIAEQMKDITARTKLPSAGTGE